MAAALRAAGVKTDVYLTEGPTDRLECLADAERAHELVVAVGGDGTIAAVLASLPKEVPLAVLPSGTANVLGIDLKLPRSVEGVTRMILSGRTTLIDVARVNDRLSFLVTGVGIDGWIVRDLAGRRRGPITKWSYVASTLRTLRRWRPPRLSVEIDGEPLGHEVAWVLASNLVGYGGLLRLGHERLLDDGRFEVYLFADSSRLALARFAARGLARRLPGAGCRMVRARRVRIESDEPVPYEVDGDYGGLTPVDIEVTGEQFRILVP